MSRSVSSKQQGEGRGDITSRLMPSRGNYQTDSHRQTRNLFSSFFVFPLERDGQTQKGIGECAVHSHGPTPSRDFERSTAVSRLYVYQNGAAATGSKKRLVFSVGNISASLFSITGGWVVGKKKKKRIISLPRIPPI